jgi:hypothetical protein
MKIVLITILAFFLNNSFDKKIHNAPSNIDYFIYQKIKSKDVLTKNEIIETLKKIGYKLIYAKNHKNISNCFFIFEHEIENKDFKQNRILIVAKLKTINEYQILYKLEDIIYDKNFTMTCFSGKNKESFNKIATSGNYITIEQNRCTETKEEILHEFLTFKYNKLYNDYLLIKYSSVLEQTKIGDEYPFKLLTNKAFGLIKLSKFTNKKFDKIKLNLSV